MLSVLMATAGMIVLRPGPSCRDLSHRAFAPLPSSLRLRGSSRRRLLAGTPAKEAGKYEAATQETHTYTYRQGVRCLRGAVRNMLEGWAVCDAQRLKAAI